MEDRTPKYIVTLSDGTIGQFTEQEYNDNKDEIYGKDRGAQVARINDYSFDDDIDETAAYTVGMPDGSFTVMDANQFRDSRDELRKVEGLQFGSLSPVDYWGEKLDGLNQQIAELEPLYEEALQKEVNLPVRDLASEEADPASAIQAVQERSSIATTRKELSNRLKKLKEEREANPAYQSQKQARIEGLQDYAEGLNKKMSELNAQYPEASAVATSPLAGYGTGVAPVSSELRRSVEENPEYYRDNSALVAAKAWINDAEKAAKTPSRYDNSRNGFQNFITGITSNVKELSTALTLAENLIKSAPLIETVKQIQKEEGDNANILQLVEEMKSDPEKMSYLSDAQKTLLESFIIKTLTDAEVADYASLGYQAGQGAIASVGFMTDFLIFGGIGDAAASGVSRLAGRGVAKIAPEVAKAAFREGISKGTAAAIERAGLKGATEKVAQAIPEFAIGTVKNTVKALAMSPLMPSSYSNLLNNLTQIDTKDGTLDLSGKAILDAAGDVLIETLSENAGGQVESLLGVPFKALGAGTGKLFANTAFGRWGQAMRNAPVTQLLKQAGWNGLIGEMGEEWYGNAIRVMTGVDKDALKNFATIDQQLITLASFAPMTIIGLGTSTGQYLASRKQMADAGERLTRVLEKNDYKEDQIQQILNVARAENPQELADGLAPVVNQIAKDNGDASEAFKAVADYAKAVAQYRVFDGRMSADAEQDRADMRAAITAQMAGDENNWVLHTTTQDDNGRETTSDNVRTLTDAQGNEYFVTSSSEEGYGAVSRTDGSHVIVKPDAIQDGTYTDSGMMSMTDFLDREIVRRKVAEDNVRMEQEQAVNRSEIYQMAQPGMQMNIGTVENPVIGTVLQVQNDQFIIDSERGAQPYTLEQVGGFLKHPLQATPQSEIDERQSDAIKRLYDKKETINERLRNGSVVTLGGSPVVRVLSPDGATITAITRDGQGNPVETNISEEELDGLMSQADNKPVADIKDDETPAPEPEDTTPRDFRGNPLPLKTRNGEQVVDWVTLWNKDPEAWAHYNDTLDNPIVDSKEKLAEAIKDLTKEQDKLSKDLRKEALHGMDEAKMDAFQDRLAEVGTRLNQLQNVLNSYNRPAEAGQTIAGEQRQAQAEKTKREQQAGFPGIQQKWEDAEKIVGVADEIRLPNGESIAGHYVMTEAEAPTASHNPAQGFTMTEGFPVDENGKTVNDRDYEHDKAAQQSVLEKAANYDQRALQTPVIVSSDGVVLSGNDRTMASQIAAANNTDGAYLDYLNKYSQKYGFTAQQVGQFQHPRVVFVPDASMPYNAATFAKFNAEEKKSQNKTEKAVKAGKTLTPDALGALATLVDQFEDINALYNDANGVDQLLNILLGAEVISQEQVAALKDGNTLSGTGMDLLESTLIGAALDEEGVRIAMSDKAIRKSIVSAISQIIVGNTLADYSLRTELTDAIALIANGKRAKEIKFGETVQNYVRQQHLFEDDVLAEATVQLLADAINDRKTSYLKKVLSLYNRDAVESANGQMSLLTNDVPSRDAILRNVLEYLGYDTGIIYDTSARAAEQGAEAEQPAEPEPEESQDASSLQGDEGSPAGQVSQYDRERAEVLLEQGNVGELAPYLTDEEITEFLRLWDEFEPFNEALGEAYTRLDADLKSKDKKVKKAAQEEIAKYENEQVQAFIPVEDFVHSLIAKYGLESEVGMQEQEETDEEEGFEEYDIEEELAEQEEPKQKKGKKSAKKKEKKAKKEEEKPYVVKGGASEATIAKQTYTQEEWEEFVYGQSTFSQFHSDKTGEFLQVYYVDDAWPIYKNHQVIVHRRLPDEDGELSKNGIYTGPNTQTTSTTDYILKYLKANEFKCIDEKKSYKNKYGYWVNPHGVIMNPIRFELPSVRKGWANSFYASIAQYDDGTWAGGPSSVVSSGEKGFETKSGAIREVINELKVRRGRNLTDKDRRDLENLINSLQTNALPQALREEGAVDNFTRVEFTAVDYDEGFQGDLFPDEEATAEPAPAETKPQAPAYGSQNKIVTTDQYEELKRRMKEKLGQLNAGFDPEVLSIGAQMATYHIEAGARQFVDFSKRMIKDLGDAIRPYLKSIYNGARDFPGMEELEPDMTPFDEVRATDVNSISVEEDVSEEAPAQEVDTMKFTGAVNDLAKGKRNEVKLSDFAEKVGESEDNSVNLPPALGGKADARDYRNYITPEAKKLFEEKAIAQGGFKQPKLAYITFASINNATIPVELLETLPEVIAAEQKLKDIQAEAKERTGYDTLQLTPEQVEEYADRLLGESNGSFVKKKDYTGPVARERKAFIVIGRSAAGKSSVFADPLSRDNKARIIDSDIVKPWLENYQDGYGTNYVHPASALVANEALIRAARLGENIVIPRIGGASVIAEIAIPLRAAGYQVELCFNDVTPEASIMRASSRFAETGRFLSLKYLKSIGDKPLNTYRNFATKTIGEALNELSETQIRDLRGRIASLSGLEGEPTGAERDGDRGGYSGLDGNVQDALGAEGLAGYLGLDGSEKLFVASEWKDNNVDFGNPPVEIWNSTSGEPFPFAQDEQKTEPATTIGELGKYTHTKTGKEMTIVRLSGDRLSKEEFKDLKARAKALGGYYSSFGNAKGFLFDNEADAIKFNNLETINNAEEETTEQVAADTTTIVGEAGAVISQVETIIQAERPGQQRAAEAVRAIDESLDKVNDQLALLGYYEADTSDESQFHESYGYRRTAEKKAVKDADRLAKKLAKDLGIDAGRKRLAKANIPPAGGDITFRLPLNEGQEVYVDISVRPAGYEAGSGYSDDLRIEGVGYPGMEIMYRIETPSASGLEKYGRNIFAPANVSYADLLKGIRSIAKDYLPEQAPVQAAGPETDILQVAKEQAEKSRKSAKKSVTSQEDGDSMMGDLFSDLAGEEETAPAPEESTAPAQRVKPTEMNGFAIGEKVLYTPSQGDRKTQQATIYDFEYDGRPVLDAGLAPVLYEVVEWDTIKKLDEPVNTTDNGSERTDDVRAEGTPADSIQSGGGAQETEGGNGEGERQEGGRTDTGGTGRSQSSERNSRHRFDDSVKRNTRNNRVAKGEVVYPKTTAARYRANIEAIRLLKELQDSGKQATKAQMAVLRQYTGWGGLGTYFNNTYTPEHRELKSLLTQEEMDAAALSINTAYYTPVEVIDSMWDVAKRLGFEGGNILEGSAGIGNILASMPKNISERSAITAVELDNITGGILEQLYPDATVHIKGFQETDIPNNSVDLAITNVPFGDIQMYDSKEKDLTRKFGGKIHDFCIAKNIRKLAEGGIGIFISTRGTLDNNSKALRQWIVNEGDADVIGAFRLNNETFEGTGATSDIIVVRKRVNGKKSPNAIDVADTVIARKEDYELDEREWNPKTRAWEFVRGKAAMEINSYFVEHPENMGGEMGFGFEHKDTYRPGSSALWPSDKIDQNKRLAKWARQFSDMQAEEQAEARQAETTEAEDSNATKEGQLITNSKGEICVSRSGKAVPLGLNAQKVKGYSKAQVLSDYDALKTAINEALDYQLKNESDEGLKPVLDKLNRAYDTFKRKYDRLNKNTAITFLRNDVDFPSVAAVEGYKETKDINGKTSITVKKTDIFSKRVLGAKRVPTPKDVKDGVIISINQYGRIDVPFIATALGKDWEDVQKEIISSGLGYENPQSGNLEVDYEYLSGNVREKLDYAREHNQDGRYDKNIEALEKAVPTDIPAHLIEFSLGSDWMPVELYTAYAKEKLGANDNFKPANLGGSWVLPEYRWDMGLNNEKNRSAGVTSEKLNMVKTGDELMIAAMNNSSVVFSKTYKDSFTGEQHTEHDKEATQAAATKISEMREDFKEWARGKMLEDPELAERVGKIYNNTFNAIVPKEISETFIPDHFEGQVLTMGKEGKPFHLYQHQSKAVIRATTEPLMMAHEVGSGKTFTLIASAMEMRRLGTAKKPMIVVQNATLGQFVSSAKELYPNAKVLTISEADRTVEGRSAFYAKIKYNDWDMIIVPQSVFEMIPDSEERQRAYIQEKIEEKEFILEQAKQAKNSTEERRLKQELEDLQYEYQFGEKPPKKGKGGKRDAKKEAEAKANAVAKAKKQLDRRTDEVADFDDMGIDALLIDEAHNYKHLGFSTAMQRGVKGVDSTGSKRSAGVYLKTRAVFDKVGWKNVVFATGTPISNTAAEIWTFMKYLMPAETMRKNHIYYFDDFVRNFGNIAQSLEFTTSGKFKENTRFASYTNLPELMRIWMSVADIVLTKEAVAAGGEKLDDKLPKMEGGQARDIYLPQSASLVDIMNAVRAKLEWYENLSGKEKKEYSYIPLTMFGIAKMAAIDPRLVDKNAKDEPQSKTNKAVEETLKALEDSKKFNGTAALFCDNFRRWDYTESGKRVEGFNIFEEIGRKLIEAGVPADQIVIMKSGMTTAAKEKIFAKVNAGEIRVIMGSTETLGTGVNIQERLFFEAHIDAPNRPMDYTQRMGRILRQGNLLKDWGIEARVVRFGVEDSLDVTAYQRLSTKSKFIDSVMNGKALVANSMENRVLEEEEEGVFDNPVAVLSGSQYALLKSQAERELRKLRNKKEQHKQDQIYIEKALKDNNNRIEFNQKLIEEGKKNLEKTKEAFPDGKVKEIAIEGKKVKPDQIAATLKEKITGPLREYLEKNRENSYFHDETKEYNMTFDGVPVKISVAVSRTSGYDERLRRFSNQMHALVEYSAPRLGINGRTVPGGVTGISSIIPDFQEKIASGSYFENGIRNMESTISRLNSDNDLMLQRRGKPFADEEKLKQQEEIVNDYTEKMKAEMAEKEAKYAEVAKNATTNFNLDNVEVEDEPQGEDSTSYRDVDENAPKLNVNDPLVLAEAVSAVNRLARRIGLRVEFDETLDAKGAYTEGNDYVSINLANCESVDDAIETLLHEGVAHLGLRKLFGKEGFTEFINDVLNNSSRSVRDATDNLVAENGWSREYAAEEYIAELAQRTDYTKMERSFWRKVVDAVRNLISMITGRPVRITDGTIREMLLESYENLGVEYNDTDFYNENWEGYTHFRERTKPAPEKTGIGYKVFYRGRDGKLYPPMVANPNGEATPVGVWLDADAAPVAGQSKTGRPKVKAGGKGTQGGSGTLAYRPGWHLGEIPYAIQFNRINPETGRKELFPRDFVWAEVEYAADKDWQKEADAEGMTEDGKYRHSYAGLKQVPEDGFYRYRTNPNPETDPWIITGAMKVNKVLSDEEVDDLVRAAGREPQLREGKNNSVRSIARDLYDRYENQNGEDKPWMSERELMEQVQAQLPYGIGTKPIFAMIDEYNRLDEEDFNEGRRDFSGGEMEDLFDRFLSALRDLGNSTVRNRVAYHGGIADFDAFDISHAGEGEGYSAHGFGHYVAFNKNTSVGYAWSNAFDYADRNGQISPELNEILRNDEFEDENAMVTRYDFLLKNRQQDALKELEEAKETDADDARLITDLQKQYNRWMSYRPLEDVFRGLRNVYTVQIPEDTGENYLNEQKELSKSAKKKIAEALRGLSEGEWKISEDENLLFGDDTANKLAEKFEKNEQYNGYEAYASLAHGFGSKKAASEFLSRLGFVGIKYNGQVDGPSAVIFKDSDMGIEGHERFRQGQQSTPSPVSYSESMGAKRLAANETASKFGIDIEFRPSSEMRFNGMPLAGRWINGKMYVCLEHCRDNNDVVRTVLHEGVGHNGLRRLIGDENMRDFCLDLFTSLPKAVRNKIATDAVNKYGGNIVSSVENFTANDVIREIGKDAMFESTEEWLAETSETIDYDNYRRNVWDIIRDALRRVLAKVGINVPLSTRDVKWLMVQSAFANHEKDALVEARRQVVAKSLGMTLRQQAEVGEARQNARNRLATEVLAPAARIYNKDVMNWMSRLHETWVDKDDSVHRLVNAIEKATGKKAAAFEDIRLALNQQSSKGLAAIEKFEREHYQPMMDAIKALMEEKGCDLKDIERYVMIKHALERNEVFAKRDAREYYEAIHDANVRKIQDSDLEKDEKDRLVAKEDSKLAKHYTAIENGTDVKYAELREQDYGGLTSLFSEYDDIEPFRQGIESNEEYQARVLQARHPKFQYIDAGGKPVVDMEETEKAAQEEVDNFENGHADAVDKLWKEINGATKATLLHQYQANMLSREQYTKVRDMFKYYVPLRGFADNTAEDMYDYYRSDQRNDFTPPLMKAKGRKTEAESPFGYIGSMASSGIAADMKNETKLALYYFVSNRAKNDLVNISEVWYEKTGEDNDGKSIFSPVYPPFKEDLSSDEAKKEYEEWEKAMIEKAQDGLAFKGRRKLDLHNSVINIDNRQKNSHIIKFKVGGKDMMMYINGNPRAAQAINNELNVEMSTDYQKFFGKVLRWFSGINTSYNPEFWLSNAQRDALFALMSVNVKEDTEYNRAFRKNFGSLLRRTLTPGAKGGAYSLKKKLDEGRLGDERLDKLYAEFVENGGVTGYTTLKNNEEWELELRKYTGDEKAAMQAVKTVFKKVQSFGEAIEQMTRFAAYMTSREQGKDVKDAVNDAKDLTVNFNRKGSGKAISFKEADRLRTNKGEKLTGLQKAFVVGASWIPVYGRRFIMFFNASTQGLNAMYKLFSKNPSKMAIWTAGYLALGVVQAVLHAMLDDDDDYLDIPDYERRNNLLLGGNGVYLKWALPQEARVFYALGDMIVNHAMGREPHRNMAGELLAAAADIAPLNPTGGIAALAPSAVSSVVEVALNRDYKGAKIFNDLKYLSDEERKQTPAYQKAFRGTGKPYIMISKFANWLSGGDYADAGWLNINPAAVEHIVQGATGGAGTTVGKFYRGTIGQIFGEDFMVRNTPFLSRILTVTDDRYRNAHTTDLFDYYKAEAEHTKKRIRTYEKNGDYDRLDKIYDSEDYEIMLIYDSYKSLMNWYNDELKYTEDNDERRELMREQDSIRKEMIMEISNIGKND